MNRIEVFVILLKSDQERVKHVTQLIEANSNYDLKFTIFQAIDGGNLTTDKMKEYVKKGFVNKNYRINQTLKIQYYKGQIGCALSHYLLWEYGLKKGIDNLVVIEDDVILCHRFADRIREVIKLLPSDYDHCFLFNHSNLVSTQVSHQLIDDSQQVNITLNQESWGTVGYLVSSAGMKELSKQLQPMQNTLDAMLRQVVQSQKIKSFMCTPNLVTTIGSLNSRDAQSPLGSNVWNSGIFN